MVWESLLIGALGGALVVVPLAIAFVALRKFHRESYTSETYTTISEMPPHARERFRRSIVSMRRSMNAMCDDFEKLVSDKGKKL